VQETAAGKIPRQLQYRRVSSSRYCTRLRLLGRRESCGFVCERRVPFKKVLGRLPVLDAGQSLPSETSAAAAFLTPPSCIITGCFFHSLCVVKQICITCSLLMPTVLLSTLLQLMSCHRSVWWCGRLALCSPTTYCGGPPTVPGKVPLYWIWDAVQVDPWEVTGRIRNTAVGSETLARPQPRVQLLLLAAGLLCVPRWLPAPATACLTVCMASWCAPWRQHSKACNSSCADTRCACKLYCLHVLPACTACLPLAIPT
jgi:hypothetical protein